MFSRLGAVRYQEIWDGMISKEFKRYDTIRYDMMCMLMLCSDTRLWFVCGMNWRNRSSVLGFWIVFWSLAPLLSINPEEKVMAECPEERETTIQGILDEMAIKAEQKLGIQRGLDISKIFKHNITVSNSVINLWMSTLCAHWCTHFSARRRRHISKTHFCQGGYVNEDAKTHFEDTLNEDEFPPEDELPREDTFRRHIKRRRISPRRRITSRRQISKTH